MNAQNAIFRPILILLAMGLIVIGCGTGSETSPAVEPAPLELTPNLTISVDNPEVLMGSFDGIAVDGSGSIYAADSDLQKIHIFSPDGTYLDSLGREGNGPGEFQRLNPVINILDGTLYARDSQEGIVTRFDLETLEPAESFIIPQEELNGAMLRGPQEIFPLNNGQILITFVNSYGLQVQTPDEAETPLMTTLSLLDNSGAFADQNVLQVPTPYPSNQGIVWVTPRNFTDLSTISSITVLPGLTFYPDNRITADSEGNIYIGKSDSLRFRKYNLSGAVTDTIRADYAPAPFTDAHLDSVIEERGTRLATAIDEIGRPDFWPAFQDFFLDDAGRIWVQLLDPGKPAQPWWVFNSEGEPQWKFELPSDITLYQVREGHAYGLSQPEGELPSIVRYQIGAM